MLVRWLGAYGYGSDLESSLEWELSQDVREVAAEHFTRGRGSAGGSARIGLRLAKGASVRDFPGDVWSRPGKDGRLYETRYASGYLVHGDRHTESFCVPVFDAIVCREHPARMGKGVCDILNRVAHKYNLPVLVLNSKGRAVPLEGHKR